MVSIVWSLSGIIAYNDGSWVGFTVGNDDDGFKYIGSDAVKVLGKNLVAKYSSLGIG